MKHKLTLTPLFLLVFAFLLGGCSSTLSPKALHVETTHSEYLQPLIVGFSADYPPLVFKKDKQFQGIEVDFAQEISKILHREIIFRNMKFKDNTLAKRIS